MNRLIIFSFFLFLFFACQKTEQTLDLTSEFTLEPGFDIKAVAAEPLLSGLVEIEFDERGRIWTLEMPGYMRDIDGSGEDIPDGKISILEDTDGDGVMDKKKVFLDELVLPRAIELIHDGLLYAEPPNLWYVTIDNDQPGKRQLVDSTYSLGGNIEHAPNGLLYNLDNWIYSAKSDRRYRYKDGQWERDATYSKGQWGISNDDAGRLYYNNNSNPIFGDLIQSKQANANPYLNSKNLENQNLSPSRRFYPSHPTLINRGYGEGSFDSLGRVIDFTSACSPMIYRGSQFQNQFYQNAFVCGPEGNLVKRYKLEFHEGESKAVATSEGYEFLTSIDETFRPVNLNNGPDGALYVVDMRQAVIQHRAYMTSYLKELLINNKMDTIPNRGRVYRVTNSNNPVDNLPDLSGLSLSDWVDKLQSPNAWHRITAQKNLVFANDKSLVKAVQEIAKDTRSPLGQIQALWTLAGMSSLDATFLADLPKDHPAVMSQVILLAKSLYDNSTSNILTPIFEKALASSDFDHHLQLAHSIVVLPNETKDKMANTIGSKYADNSAMANALVSSLYGKEEQFLERLQAKGKNSKLTETLSTAIDNKVNDKKELITLNNNDQTDNRTRGFLLYNSYCATCHGIDGKGLENLAPPLYQTEYTAGPTEHMALIMLHGLRGPITIHGEIYEGAAVMPGIKDNPDISDRDIIDIIAYIKNGFTTDASWSNMKQEDVARLRAKTADRKEMFTEQELQEWSIISEQ